MGRGGSTTVAVCRGRTASAMSSAPLTFFMLAILAPMVAAYSVAAAGERLASAQAAALQSIVSANNMYASDPVQFPLTSGQASVKPYIPEAPKRDSEALGLEAAREAASARSVNAPKGEVAWCSSLSCDEQLWSLTAWNSPQINVPHFYWAAGLVERGQKLALTIDFRPRAEAGYDTVLPDGSYPEPSAPAVPEHTRLARTLLSAHTWAFGSPRVLSARPRSEPRYVYAWIHAQRFRGGLLHSGRRGVARRRSRHRRRRGGC